jgi:hypothetical protein
LGDRIQHVLDVLRLHRQYRVVDPDRSVPGDPLAERRVEVHHHDGGGARVIARSTAAESRQSVDGSTSTGIGTALTPATVEAFATQVRPGMITSLPAPTPHASSATMRLAVPLEVGTQWSIAWNVANASAKRRSKLCFR